MLFLLRVVKCFIATHCRLAGSYTSNTQYLPRTEFIETTYKAALFETLHGIISQEGAAALQ